jgi:NAD(P)-dependent dehydrogenase (short-subunit alcohol dehydrogenase family)
VGVDGRRIALVVGAGRGIGRAVARGLAQAGHHVVGTHHTSTPDPDAGADIWYRCDLSEPAAAEALVRDVSRSVGPVDVLVSSAAVISDRLLLHTRDEEWAETLTVDLVSQQRLMRAAVPGMVASRWGRVVLISSVAALAGSSGQSAYATAKAAAAGLARQVAVEVAADGVTVNVVAPGAVATEQLARRSGPHLDAMARVIPAGRLGTAEEIAAVVAFLCTDDASFVNGVIIPVDGGLLIGGGFVRSNRDRLRAAATDR